MVVLNIVQNALTGDLGLNGWETSFGVIAWLQMCKQAGLIEALGTESTGSKRIPIPAGETPATYLRRLTEEGMQRRWPQGVPGKVTGLVEHELELIGEHAPGTHRAAYCVPVANAVDVGEAAPRPLVAGIAEAYGGYVAYLDIRPDGIFAGYPAGQLPLPQGSDDLIAYLEQVIARDPDNPYLKERLARLQQPEAPPAESEPEESGEVEAAGDAVEMPICGISP
mgnify:CR=1 FL=1